MEPSAHIHALQREGDQLATAAGQAGLRAGVPSCPGWQVRDLLRHLGYVHRWAASYLIEQRQEPAAELTEAEQLAAGPADDELIAWYRAGHAAIVVRVDERGSRHQLLDVPARAVIAGILGPAAGA